MYLQGYIWNQIKIKALCNQIWKCTITRIPQQLGYAVESILTEIPLNKNIASGILLNIPTIMRYSENMYGLEICHRIHSNMQFISSFLRMKFCLEAHYKMAVKDLHDLSHNHTLVVNHETMIHC